MAQTTREHTGTHARTHRDWRTPYLLPESTRPSMSGMRSCGIPQPLSLHVTR